MNNRIQARRRTILGMTQALAITTVMFAGCLSQGGVDPRAGPASPEAPGMIVQNVAVAVPECPFSCFETTVAVDSMGRIFVAANDNDAEIAVSTDRGASFIPVALPPMPAGIDFRGDNMVHAAGDGRLYFSALAFRSVTGLPSTGVSPTAAYAVAGIEVASSNDGGATWEHDSVSHVGIEGGGHTVKSDRQWLAFGPGQTVYVAFQRPVSLSPAPFFASEVVVGRSDDGGRSFGAFRSLTPQPQHVGSVIIGQPVVDSAGALHLAYFAYPDSRLPGAGPYQLRFATSTDGGETFTQTTLPATEDSPGAWFPSTAVGPGGELFVAWNGLAGSILLTRSVDGGLSWDVPTNVSAPGDEAYSSPWAIVDESGGVHVAYYALTGDMSSRLVLASVIGNQTSWVSIAANVTAAFPGRPSNTDMAHMTAGRETGLIVVWGDAETRTASVAFVEPAGTDP